MSLQYKIGISVAGIALLAAGCGGGSGGNKQTVTSGSAPAAVATHSGPNGTYLTDGNGKTLYVFSKDTGSSSTCSGACMSEWPPLTTKGAPTASSGAQSSMLGTTSRGGGVTQVTYNGHPVYYFSGDSSTGDMNGQGLTDFGGHWAIAGPDGSPLTAATSPSAAPSSSSSGSEWG